ncbi:MAG: hypothetical protein IJB24_07935 [Clostridia bacterium]|nr:hypothetical protein [Clostridia bacterium]MBQ4602774.1 hypothetical protein [Clostridia bacterium]
MEEKIEALTLKLIEKIERAIEELDSYTLTKTTKEKNTEYDDEGKKAVSETIVETEEISIVKGTVNASNLKTIAAAIKELRGKDEETENEGITVILSEEIKELSE